MFFFASHRQPRIPPRQILVEKITARAPSSNFRRRSDGKRRLGSNREPNHHRPDPSLRRN